MTKKKITAQQLDLWERLSDVACPHPSSGRRVSFGLDLTTVDETSDHEWTVTGYYTSDGVTYSRKAYELTLPEQTVRVAQIHARGIQSLSASGGPFSRRATLVDLLCDGVDPAHTEQGAGK